MHNERRPNPYLITKSLLHAERLHTEGLQELGVTDDQLPVDGLRYITNQARDIATYDVHFINTHGQSFRNRLAKKLDPIGEDIFLRTTRGMSARIERSSLIVQETFGLDLITGQVQLEQFVIRALHDVNYKESNPKQANGKDFRQLRDVDQIEFEMEGFLKVTPDHLYVDDDPKATPEQLKYIEADVREEVLSLLRASRIDPTSYNQRATLSFKIGADDATASIHFSPRHIGQADEQYVNSRGNETHIGYNPYINATIEINGSCLNTFIHTDPLNEERFSASLQPAHTEYDVPLDRVSELRYIQQLFQHLKIHAKEGALNNTGEYRPVTSFSMAFLKTIPEIHGAATVKEFITSRIG